MPGIYVAIVLENGENTNHCNNIKIYILETVFKI
jgi:hypothetical protein